MPARHRRRRHALRPGPHLQAPHPHGRARQGGVQGRHLGRGAQLRRRPDEEDRGRARARVDRAVEARHGLALLRARDARLRLHQQGRALLRAVPRPARHRLPPHLRHRPGLARTHGHRQHEVPGPHRHAPRREHAQHAGAGVRAGHRQQGDHHRGRPALLGGREQGQVLAADQARHRHGARPRVDERAGRPKASTTRNSSRSTATASTSSPPPSRTTRPSGPRARRASPAATIRATAREMATDAPRHPRAPRPPRQLVRRRRAARALHGAAERAARQLGPPGRALPAGRHERGRLSASRSSPRRRSPRSTTRTASGRSPTRK